MTTPIMFLSHIGRHEPTEAQRKAGNYPKRKMAWRGLTISIENEAGSVRRGTKPDGTPWATRIIFPYGYFLESEGVDGDHLDVFVGPFLDAPNAYIVHQRKVGDWKKYDEDKTFVGFHSEEDARSAFLANYDDARFLGPITTMPAEEFVAKVKATKDKPAMIKAIVRAHDRHLANGAVVHVNAHSDSRPSAQLVLFHTPAPEADKPEPEPDAFDPAKAVHLIADDVSKIRPQDLDRLFAETDRSNYDDLRVYIIEHRSDLGAAVLDAIEDNGGAKRDEGPQIDLGAMYARHAEKGEKIKAALAAGKKVAVPSMTLVRWLSDPSQIKVGKTGVYVARGKHWDAIPEASLDAMVAMAERPVEAPALSPEEAASAYTKAMKDRHKADRELSKLTLYRDPPADTPEGKKVARLRSKIAEADRVMEQTYDLKPAPRSTAAFLRPTPTS